MTNIQCDGNKLKCVCGNWIASIVNGNIEIYCRKCKRKHLITIEPKGGQDE